MDATKEENDWLRWLGRYVGTLSMVGGHRGNTSRCWFLAITLA